ncbi:FHA domain-containing protein [Frankia canadensis]|uniref:FHA domain-containing protein n=1 Tax=Frankia canadensis TaxID=1836972 RepID=A0A2I2KYB6_9ACTN|nr:FHA domain-containing protein [Frankia canadensis]SNQ50655.1 FHA domain-containing protein [Frankia canadensis]SOU57945.1 FHA domain-containing protein [Frankia canadensis]
MTGQERYEYRPDDGGRSPYGTDEPGGQRRRGPAQPDGPDAGGGGYDPLGIRRSPADLAGVSDPPRGGDPYGGYDRDDYADQPRGGRGYQADGYDAPAGYDRDPYARRRDDRPGPDERADRGRDPYARDWPADDRGGYPPPGRDARDDRAPAGYPDGGGRDPYGREPDDRDGRGGYPPPAREARGDDRGGYAEPDRGGYPPARDGRGYGDELDREPDARRARRDEGGYGYQADPLGLDPSVAPERGFQGRGGDPRHTTDPRYARQGGDPRLDEADLDDPRRGDPRAAARRDPRDPADDPRGAGGWDREPDRAPAGASVWEAIVEAEREYYDSGDDHRVPFPTFYPRRVFALTGPKMLIGRRSESRGIHPDIDLSGAPEDPGISRSHAMFEQLPDGGYAVRDPGSTNGTRLNDEPDPIEPGQPVPLRDGDRVYLGAWTRITLRAR